MQPQLLTPTSTSYPIQDAEAFKRHLLQWADHHFSTCAFLDSNQYRVPGTSQHTECILAVGQIDVLSIKKAGVENQDAFAALKVFYEKHQSYVFTALSYDLKNEVEKDLTSNNIDGLNFPDLHCFVPEAIFEVKNEELIVQHIKTPGQNYLSEILAFVPVNKPGRNQAISLQARIEKPDYLKIIDNIKQHIAIGDIYEMNFCQEFFAEHIEVDPLSLFLKLNKISKAPFTAYYKQNGNHLICASPERFLRKEGQRLISQPIKGTRPRSSDEAKDKTLKTDLFHSQKDRSENVMVVDMVRNDLAKSCIAGSVKVDELYGIYSFEHVHQMISTVSGTLKEDVHFVDAIRDAYPMGSMTGTPKIKAMQLIEQYEVSKRGWYSGTVGYFRPNGDFDLNVVIRSLLYSEQNQYLSYQVGGAIVYDSVPEEEYQECLVKAKGILETLK